MSLQQVQKSKHGPMVVVAILDLILLAIAGTYNLVPQYPAPPTNTTNSTATYLAVIVGAFAGAVVISRTHFSFIGETVLSTLVAVGVTAIIYGVLAYALSPYVIAIAITAFLSAAIGKLIFKKKL